MPPLYFEASSGKARDIPEAQTRYLPEGVLPLAELLVAQEFPFALDDFSRPSISDWQAKDVKEAGTLIARDLAELDPPADFTKRIVNRLHILGIFPHYEYFRRKSDFVDFVEFKASISPDPVRPLRDGTRNTRYKSLTLTELSGLLVQRYNELLELPAGERFEGPLTSSIIETMNRMELSPGRRYIEHHYGGITKINEELGWPDVRAMDKHDYVLYGADVLRYNGPASLTYDNIKLLSAHHLGPDYETIALKIDWEKFKRFARDELASQLSQEQTHKSVVDDYYRTRVNQNAENVPFTEKAKHRALDMLLRQYLGKQRQTLTIPKGLAGFSTANILRSIQHRANVTLSDIEETAITLDIFDDLWPMSKPKRLPILAAIQAKQTAKASRIQQLPRLR